MVTVDGERSIILRRAVRLVRRFKVAGLMLWAAERSYSGTLYLYFRGMGGRKKRQRGDRRVAVRISTHDGSPGVVERFRGWPIVLEYRV